MGLGVSRGLAARALAVAVLALYLMAPTAAALSAQLPGGVGKVRLIVKVNPKLFKMADIAGMGGRVLYRASLAPIVIVEVPSFMADAVGKLRGVLHVSRDAPVRIYGDVVPWGVSYVKAPSVWDAATTGAVDADGDGSRDVEVAVIDTGVDPSHPDLKDNVAWCISVIGGTVSSDCYDGNGHGTHVAGTIAALLDGYGLVGVAPGVEIYAIKALGDDGSGTFSDIIMAIDMAIKGPDGVVDRDGDGLVAGDPDDDAPEVISMSLGGSYAPTELHDIIQQAYSYGIVIVAAAGNEGAQSPAYPAAYPEVIAVGAIDSSEQVPSWSNRNPEVAAPGVDINSTWPGGGYNVISGTSMATPHVSAVVALMQAARMAKGLPVLPPGSFDDTGNDTVRGILHSTAKDLGSPGYDSLYGYGAVQADAAVAAALGGTQEEPPETPQPSPEPQPGAPSIVGLVENPGFDSSLEPWSFYPGSYIDKAEWYSSLAGREGVAAVYGTVPAWSFSVSDSAFLAQQVTVPADASEVNITVEYYAYSDSSRATIYVVAGFYDTEAGSWIWYTTEKATPGAWATLSATVPSDALDAMRGRTVLYVVGVYAQTFTIWSSNTIALLLDSADAVASTG